MVWTQLCAVHSTIQKCFSWAADQYIRMISEGSCDTEDWRNDAENSALITGINYILKHIQNMHTYLNVLLSISAVLFYCIFCQINAALVNFFELFSHLV